MSEEPTKDLATRAFQKRVIDEFTAIRGEQSAMREFQKRVIDEFASMRSEQAAMRKDITEIRTDIVGIRTDIVEIRTDVAEVRAQQTAMAKNVAALDQRVTSIDGRLTTREEKVDERLKETRPIWEAVQVQLQRVVDKFDVVLRDIYDVRIDVQIHGRRIGELERRAS